MGDPLMGPAIGVVLTLSRWIRQVVLRGHQPADRRTDQAVRYGLSCNLKIFDLVDWLLIVGLVSADQSCVCQFLL